MSIVRRKAARRACGLLVILVAYLRFWPDRPGHLSRENFEHVRHTYQEAVGRLGPPTAEGWVVSPRAGTWILISTWDTDTARAFVNTTESGEIKLRGYQKRPPRETLRRWWSRACGRPAPF